MTRTQYLGGKQTPEQAKAEQAYVKKIQKEEFDKMIGGLFLYLCIAVFIIAIGGWAIFAAILLFLAVVCFKAFVEMNIDSM